MAVAFGARGALRVLPFVQEALRRGKPTYIVVPVFRALAFAWTSANYSTPPKGYTAPMNLGAFGLASRAATDAAAAANAARVTVSKPSLATEVFWRADSIFASARAPASSTAFGIAAAAAAERAFWSAVSDDAKLVAGGAAASIVACSPLWSQPQGQRDQLRSLWQEMEQALLAANENWHVWINWYRDRLEGRVRGEESEIAFVRVEEALWDQGPAIVNAEIIRLVGKAENIPADTPPFGALQSSSAANPILAAWQPIDQPGVIAGLFNAL